MTISSKERAQLRAEANKLAALVHVGKEGLTPTVFQTLDDALRTRELVKVQLGRQVETRAKDAANALALATHSDVVQVIGKTATLYRPNPDIPGKTGDVPPWRR